MEPIILIVLAVFIDLTIGDPPNAVHPVAWMGRFISVLEKIGLLLPRLGQLIYGIFITILVAGIAGAVTYFIMEWLEATFNPLGGLTLIVNPLIAAFLLKLSFTVSGLRRSADDIKKLLLMDELEQTRRELKALVSRDTSKLTISQMSSSAIESVAEGLCDSVVAPLFYYLIFGLPGAFVYRAVNTLDSMIGYHGKYEHLGKFAARLDDVLNYIPARLAFLFITLSAAFRGKGKEAWRTARRDHHLTSSPNAGWPMSAMAGALQVRLEKPGHYVLGEGPEPSPEHISRAISIFTVAAAGWLVVCGIAGGIYLVF